MPAKQKWVVAPPPDPELVREYGREFGLSEVVVALAIQRGFAEKKDLECFLYPRLKDLDDPSLLAGVETAVDRLLEAIDHRQSVVLYGDYDVDGVSSVALLSNVLNAYGLKPALFLPARLDEGYGLSVQGIQNSLGGTKPDLLIAADCGTNSCQEAELLKQQKVDLIILDHHEPNPEGTAECVAMVNPKTGDDYHYLCTAGVVFKVAHALLKRRPVPGFDLKDHLDLVALGTIADIVPLERENRIVARRGLMQLDRTVHPGLEALKRVAGVSAPVGSHDVGFKLGPRLNASGRLDRATASLDLVLCQDDREASQLAEDLDQWNRERQALELETREDAEEIIRSLPSEQRSHAIVVGKRDWHPGIVGIVASRISKQYHRPTFIVGFDESGLGKGSGRSVEGISLVEALEGCRELIEAGGGHEMAAGVSVREENLEAFRESVIRNVEEQANTETLIPKLSIDAEVSFRDLTMDLLDSYELLKPFGAGNPQPLFMARGVEVVMPPRVIKEKHLKFRFRQGSADHEGIYFNSSDLDLPQGQWDIAFTIDRNEWRGRVKLNMVVQGVRKAS
ncbi:MAG: single-stranded-DNA-specific exonuclease RecJ [Verrucomicrobiota bacterium]